MGEAAAVSGTGAPPSFSFPMPDGFLDEVRARAGAHFASRGGARRGGLRLHAKAALVVLWLVVSYLLLVFVVTSWWQAVLAALSLGLAMAGAGFCVQHDGNHGAFARRPTGNRVAGCMLDVLGGSSYYWRYQHNVLHHRYTNLAGADYDIDTSGVARLSPAQPWRPHHRYQHLYLWFLYGVVPIKWQLYGDFQQLAAGRLGPQPVPRPRGGDLAVFAGGKALFASLAFVVPMLVHPWPVVLAVYVPTMAVMGVMVAVVFGMAHSNDLAEHPLLPSGDVGVEWGRFQVLTTVDVRVRSRLLRGYLGGLDRQIEHHLFPRVAHVHYGELAPLVAAAAGRWGVPYRVQPSVRAAVASHYRFLAALARAPEPAGGRNSAAVTVDPA